MRALIWAYFALTGWLNEEIQQRQGWLCRQASSLQASTSGRPEFSSRTEHMLTGTRFCISDVRPQLQQQRQATGVTTPTILCKQSSINSRLSPNAGIEHCRMQRSAACKAGSLRSGSAGTAGRNQTGPACKAGSSGFVNKAFTAAAAHRTEQSSSASAGAVSSSKRRDHSAKDQAPASANAHGATSQGCVDSTAMALCKRTAAAFPRFQRGQSTVSRVGLHRKGHMKKGLARQGCYNQGYSKQGHAGEDAVTESQADWYEVAEEFERMLIPAGE